MARRDAALIRAYIAQTRDAYSVPIRIKWDSDEQTSPGWKYTEYELQGIPLRVAVGMRDMNNGVVEVYRRDTGEKSLIKLEHLTDYLRETLHDIQHDMREKNTLLREKNTIKVDTYDAFKQALDAGKFVLAHRDGTAETEAKIKEECQCVTRCIPFDSPEESGVCIYSGKPSQRRVLFARAY